MAKPRLSEGRIPFQLGISSGVIPPPPTQPPYQGDAYRYDFPGGTSSIAGGTVFDGPNQGTALGSVTGGTIQPDPNQGSPTGTTTGGTILNPDKIYD